MKLQSNSGYKLTLQAIRKNDKLPFILLSQIQQGVSFDLCSFRVGSADYLMRTETNTHDAFARVDVQS